MDQVGAKQTKNTIWSLPYIILMLVNFAQSTAAFMTNTTLPVYADFLGASTAMVGVVSSSFAVTALLIRPFAGPAFDSFSRKWFLLATQAVICLSMFLYGVVEDLGMLIAVRMLQGVGIGCGGPLALSLVSEYLPQDKFSSGISIYTLAQSVAQVVGPALGLFLVDSFGFSWSYILAACCVLAAMCGIFIIKEPPRELLPYKLKLDRMFAKEALSPACALMLLAMSFSCMGAYVVLYGYEYGIMNMGLFFVIYAACLIATRPLFGKLSDKFGAPRLLFLGVLFFGASYIALSSAHDFGGFAIAAVLGSAGFGVCAPLLQSLALASVPNERRGSASNTAFTGLDIGTLCGPVLGGMAVEALLPAVGSLGAAYSYMWLVMLVPACGTLAIVVIWNLKMRRKYS